MKLGITGRLCIAVFALCGFAATARAATYLKCTPQNEPTNVQLNLTIDFGVNTIGGVLNSAPLTDAYGGKVLPIQVSSSEVRWSAKWGVAWVDFALNRMTGILQLTLSGSVGVYQCAVNADPKPMF